MGLPHSERYDEEYYHLGLKSDQNETPLQCVLTSEIDIQLVESWGQSEYIGLTGIEVIDECGENIPLRESQIAAYPRDLASLGWTKDVRKLENLFFKDNLSISSSCMWLVPMRYKNEPPIIRVGLYLAFKY